MPSSSVKFPFRMPRKQQVESLRLALDHGEVVPYFQPVVDLKSGQLSGFEVLARRTSGTKGATLPPDMILLAEEAGLIDRITEALLVRTGELARTLPRHLRYAVNITPAQFCEAGFSQKLLTLTQETDLDPAQLTIEITEGALLKNFELALATSGELRAYGVQLALDDFGTGYSSLRHLQALPFDELKIDGSFVGSMSNLRASRKIVAATVGLGHSLGMMTVAEGIETPEQAEMLFYLGCGRGQGWFFSPPMPAAEVEGYVERSGMRAPSLREYAGTTIGTTLEMLPAQRLSQLQAIYDGAPVILYFLDRNMRYVSLNKQFTAAYGKPVESYIGRTVREVMPEVFTMIEPYLVKAMAGEPTKDLEISLKDPAEARGLRTFLVTYQPARDEVDEVIGISCVAMDITERKQAEDALRRSVEHYWRAAGTSPQIGWTANPEGDIIDISPRWEIITGMTYDDVVEGRWMRAVEPEDRQQALIWWNRSISTGAPLDMLFRVRAKDGRSLWIRATAAPRCTPEGSIIRWYGTLEVIDARRGAQGSLFSSGVV